MQEIYPEEFEAEKEAKQEALDDAQHSLRMEISMQEYNTLVKDISNTESQIDLDAIGRSLLFLYGRRDRR